MATLKGRAQHKLFAAQKKIFLKPLSVGDAHAVALTVMYSSAAKLLQAAMESKAGKKSKQKYDHDTFAKAISSVIDHRNGSIYAAFVTAVDAKRVFHGDRFAVSLARLGVTDELRNTLLSNNFTDIAEVVALKAPWFWADYIVEELGTVRKETSSLVTRIVSRFGEALEPQDVDNLLEVALFPGAITMAPAKIQVLTGADQLRVMGLQQLYTNMFRQLAQSPNIELAKSSDITPLDKNSSFEGVFETFYQHLLTDTEKLQRLLPNTTFGGKKLTPMQLHHIFMDTQLERRLKLAFMDAYIRSLHAVSMEKLHRAIRKYSIHTELSRAARIKVNIKLNDDAALALTTGIIGLFFAFAGEMKGQSFPLMKAIKG